MVRLPFTYIAGERAAKQIAFAAFKACCFVSPFYKCLWLKHLTLRKLHLGFLCCIILQIQLF
jgi:hypothetical protein